MAFVLALVHKVYELKEFLELNSYRRAKFRTQQASHTKMDRYRVDLIRPGIPNMPSFMVADASAEADRSSGTLLARTWFCAILLSFLLMVLGNNLHNRRVLYCGFYVAFELVLEICDIHMSWFERRVPLYQFIIECYYSKQDRVAAPKDENGRELPDWLREAEEREMVQKESCMTKRSWYSVILQYVFNYGIKVYILSLYFNSFYVREGQSHAIASNNL